MYPFTFYNPVRIHFGADSIQKLPTEVPNGSKVLVLYGGGSVKKNGVFDAAMEQLSGNEVFEFGGIEPNPDVATLSKAIQLGIEKKVDFIIALGGGSVLDGTKLVAAAIANPTVEPWDIVTAKAEVNTATPWGAVLTLPATGSEMNCFSVISRRETKEKKDFANPAVYPKFSILDPAYTQTLPDRQVANGIVDAFVHTAEQYLTNGSGTPLQDRFAESIMQTLIEVGPKTLQNKEDLASRGVFMWSATMALNGVIGAGAAQDWATHMIGHEITALSGLDHGRTLAVVLPSLLSVKMTSRQNKLAQYGRRVWNLTGDDKAVAEQAIVKTKEFFNSVGVATSLTDAGVDPNICPEIEKRLTSKNQPLGFCGDISNEDLKTILEAIK